MKNLILKALALTILFSSASCSSPASLFGNKAEVEEILAQQEALIGHWVVESGLSESMVLGIQSDAEVLKLKTPTGNKEVMAVKKLGELGFVLEVKEGDGVEKVMARFNSYQRNTLTLMNAQIIPGFSAEMSVTLRKAKEETVLTASSND